MTPSTTSAPARLASVDVYRGFVMFLMMAEVMRYAEMATANPNSTFWRLLGYHQTHSLWAGCTLHDLIQPSFSFLVGVVLPFSMSSRVLEKGRRQAVFHAIRRALILIFLGIFLRSQFSKQTYFTFEDTLTQIGLGYPFLFLLGFARVRTQVATLVSIILGYWLLFALYPLPGADFPYDKVGVPPDWPHNFSGFAAHWNKNTNPAWAFDRWFLNLFPREEEFWGNGGGYSTLSFIPTLATMILGLLAGNWFKETLLPTERLRRFVLAGVGGIVLGLALHYTGIAPSVKPIWSSGWVIFSGGWCFLLLALFYWAVDVRDNKPWFYFFTVIGTNSIAAYVMAHTVDRFISDSLKIHLGQNYASIFGASYAPFVHGFLVFMGMWLMLRWMYRKRIFIKV